VAGIRRPASCYVVAVSGGVERQVRDGRPEHDGQVGLTFSRREVLRAGVVGGAALAYGAALSPTAAPAAVSPGAVSPAGVYDFNQNWLFGGAYASGAEATGYSETGFANVTLPHTVTPLSWGDWDPSSWEQLWVYRKHIAQSAVAGNRVFVEFQGVMTSATVFLGGVQIAQHQGGYLPWSVELTPFLLAGDNVLAVVVDARWLDVPPDGAAAGAQGVDYLQPGGIYRDVALRLVPKVFISDVFAKPTDVLSSDPSVDVQLTIDAATVPDRPVTISAELLDGESRVASAIGAVSVSATGVTVVTVTITSGGGVTLWSPDTPKLYGIRATITADGVPHAVQVRIGFRQAIFETGGFYLNGERLEIFGLNRHQLFPYTGMAAPERLQRRDAELLKNELNCNMVRCSHYPQSPHFLDACDELGLMVWEEPPGWQYVGDTAFQNIVLLNVHDMVVRDRNRPSVIVWATRLNETGDYTSLYAQTRQLAYALDGSRQSTGAVDSQSTAEWAEDLFAYDDYHALAGDAILEPPVPGVPYMVTEAVGALDGAPLYRWVDTQATLALQAQLHAQAHDVAQSNPAYAGLLGWAGIDYASLNGGVRIWHALKWAGVLDTFRVPKPGAAFYRSQIDPAVRPVILPVFFWDFGPGSPAKGPGQGAMIATNCDRLELYVAGKHFTTGAPDTQDFGSLAYPPVYVDLTVDGTALPQLRVDGYVAGQLVASLTMSSDPTQDRLVLNLEDSAIQGDGNDMTRFTFRALDAYGNQRPYPAGDVTLALTGPATLIGENPFPFASYGGVGGALIRSQLGSSGGVTVTATHPRLGQATGSLTVEAASEFAPSSSPAPPGTPAAAVRLAASAASPRPTLRELSAARVRSALAGVLSPVGAQARISRLLENSGYTFEFDAPSSGRLVIDWYYVPKGAHVARKIRPKKVLVAATGIAIPEAGHSEVKIRLTARGRSLLRHAQHERLTARAGFTPTGQSTTTSSKVINLKR
jgi:beta-galactosidase